ncbi:MAG: DUF4097 family beta strand repeat protein [Clostridia bacterium]|nr:DUF4097 family beta strand repeat protein [Clostridia bacterium]
MSRAKKTIIAVSLMAVGLIMFTVALFAIDFNFAKLSIAKYETNTHNITESFDSISINSDTADITLLPSQDGKCKVICYEKEKGKHNVSVKDGTLIIEMVNEKSWYDYILDFGLDKITVFLPENEYKDITLRSDTGDIEISEEFKLKSIDIYVSTGEVTNYASVSGNVKIGVSTGEVLIENANTGSMEITASTGNVTLKNTICEGKVRIETSTGDVELIRCDADEIYIEASTGDIKGTVLTDKTFIADSSTGDVSVPKDTRGGVCVLKTSTGDIEMRVVS